MSEPHTAGNGAISTPPRIVNGLTVRPREKVRVWRFLGVYLGGVFVPEVVALIFGMRRILKHLDSRGGDAT